MKDEKQITFDEVTSKLRKHQVVYQSLEYGRTPAKPHGTRTLYVISDYGICVDNLTALQHDLQDGYGVNVQIVRSDNTKWIDRSFIWLGSEEEKPERHPILSEKWHIGQYGVFVWDGDGKAVLHKYPELSSRVPDLLRLVVPHVENFLSGSHEEICKVLNDMGMGVQCRKS